MSLVGKNAIVTGGASGIGLAACRRLAHDGAGIAVWDIDEAGAQRAAAELVAAGGRAIA
jgi:2-hydroxycyclohexanecarboxyl-CoA dehydrogenase